MDDNIRVAVLMSTYNGENFIQKQIDSILSQRGSFEIKLYVRDDGSTDSTISILKQYEEKGHLKWYKGDNLGPAKSFIDLVKKCPEYDFYSFADQDDMWLEGKIERAINMLSGIKTRCVYFSNAYVADKNLNISDRVVYKFHPAVDFKTVSCYGGILGCTMVFNAEMAKAIKEVYEPQNIIMHDFYVAEVCLALGGKLLYDSTPTMKYRIHGNNTIGVPRNTIEKIRDRIDIIKHVCNISIATQAKEINSLYKMKMDIENYRWLNEVAEYRDSFMDRFRLATSMNVKYPNLNLGITARLAILFGNK